MTSRRVFIIGSVTAIVAAGTGAAVAQSPRQEGAISVLATNAIVGPLTAIADEHKKQTGQQVNVEFDTSTSINRRFAAGTLTGVNVLVAADGTVDQAIKGGKALADTRVRLGKVGVGVAIKRGGQRPDLKSVDGLRAALLKADAVVYSQGASGVYVQTMLQKLGLMEQLKSRAVQLATGADMIERVQKSGGNEIGMTQISEIVRAVEETNGAVVLAGPLPASIQNYTIFDAVVMSAPSDAARAFVRRLAAPATQKLLAANAWEVGN
jgi:molybdate transport system substrate-binding protein